MKKLILLLVIASMVVSGCTKLAEEVTEAGIEQDGGDVNVDQDGDTVTIESGDGSGAINIGEGTQLPPELNIPVPDGGTVLISMVFEDQGVSATVEFAGDRFDEFSAFYTSELEDDEGFSSNLGEAAGTKTLILQSVEAFVAVSYSEDVDNTTIKLNQLP